MEPNKPPGCFPLGMVLQGKPGFGQPKSGIFVAVGTNAEPALLPHFISDNVYYPGHEGPPGTAGIRTQGPWAGGTRVGHGDPQGAQGAGALLA